MRNFVLLVLVLSALWLGMSGLYKPLILGLGVLGLAAVLLLVQRFNLLDDEAVPYVHLASLAVYAVWLIGEIIKSNYRVIRACVVADLDIRPTLVKVKTNCQSDLAKTIFANSITLTPGTVTIAVEGGKILVHGLYDTDCETDDFVEMDARARKSVGEGNEKKTGGSAP